MPESNVYLLRITEGARCVAEAPLIVHDKEAAQRLWLEGFAQIAHGIVGAVFQGMVVACAEQEPPVPIVCLDIKRGSGIQVVRQIPGNGDKGMP